MLDDNHRQTLKQCSSYSCINSSSNSILAVGRKL